jgi:hypothetical protein
MNFDWMDCGSGYFRCATYEPVKIKALSFGGTMQDARITDMGYIMPKDGRLMAHTYGSVNPDAPGAWFDNIDDAKRYVEEQALIGLTLNKLTR